MKPILRVWVDKHLADTVPIKNGLKQGDALLPLFFNFALGMPLRGFMEIRRA
jgi:hypothetical protein